MSTVIRVYFVFIVITALIYSANGRSGATRPSKANCNALTSDCFLTKLEKPVNFWNSISFFFGNKRKNKEREKGRGFNSELSILPRNQQESSSTEKIGKYVTKAPFKSDITQSDPVAEYRRVKENIKYLENDGCGRGLEPRILRGEHTLPGEFPWLARLQYKEKVTGKKFYGCGGSLISPNYILTAAHCLTKYGLKLKSVRLGEYNTKMYSMNCTENEIIFSKYLEIDTCEPARDYDVYSFVVHHNFVPGKQLADDIALIKLKKSVQYTDYIQPVCLPIGRYKLNLNLTSDLMAAGWGMTERSRGSIIPFKARTPLMEMEACRHLIGRNLFPGQLCVGGGSGGSSCHGDSGGPLVLKTVFNDFDNTVDGFLNDSYNRTIQVGIISGGTRECKVQPTLFTNVENYMWWILKNLKT